MRLSLRRYQSIPMNSAEEAQVVRVVGDAAIATCSVGHGRLIPLIIIDTTNRPDLTEVIEVQTHFPEGDVIVQWACLPKRRDHIALLLKFQRPTERAAVIEFDIAKQGILVEHILQSKALYIQAGKAGDRLIHDLNRPKMLIEVPDTGIRALWDKLFFDAVVKLMRKDGLSRREAKEAARAAIGEIRELAKFRMKSAPGGVDIMKV
jgi:hypothetical protein